MIQSVTAITRINAIKEMTLKVYKTIYILFNLCCISFFKKSFTSFHQTQLVSTLSVLMRFVF